MKENDSMLENFIIENNILIKQKRIDTNSPYYRCLAELNAQIRRAQRFLWQEFMEEYRRKMRALKIDDQNVFFYNERTLERAYKNWLMELEESFKKDGAEARAEETKKGLQEQLVREKKDPKTIAARNAIRNAPTPNKYEIPPRRK